MSGPTATSSIPGAEHGRENALSRAYSYPVVKDTLTYTHTYLESHSLTSSLYHRVAALSASILARLEPLQKRFEPQLEVADGYANKTLDFIEKKVPQVKMETSELVGRARQPADQAFEVAQGYKHGIQQRVSPFTEPILNRLQQGQETLTHLQERLAATVKNGKHSIPTDQESLQATLSSLQNELDGLVKATKAIPANAQATAKPIVDGLRQAAVDVRSEMSRKDIPLGAKASNVLQYSQERLNPVLAQVKDYLGVAQEKAEATAGEAKDRVNSA
ncbi:hypothetical protein JCM10213_006134 [Rhodosporidiobolus nylandii]